MALNSNQSNLITKEILLLLESLVNDLGVVDYKITLTEGSVRGDNYLGIIAKAMINGCDTKTGKNVSLNFIIKSAPQQGIIRDLGPLRAAYEREIYTYSKVLPEFEQLQHERRIKDPFTSYAKFYKSTMADMNEALVMQDMKSLGFCMGNRQESLDYNHVLLVMREYGKLHALSFALHEYKPEVFETLAKNMHESMFKIWKDNNDLKKSFTTTNSERALKAFDPVVDRVIYKKMEDFIENSMDRLSVLLEPESAGKYVVLGHGDNWINNMLFKYENSATPHKPTQLCLLDWQLARIGSPALDLSYFLFTSTDKALRHKYYEHLINEYHSSLSNFLNELGCDSNKLFPFKILQEHLRQYSAFGLFMSMIVLYYMVSDVEEIPDIHDEQYKNPEDLDSNKFQTKNIDKYHERIRDVVFDFVKFNYNF